MALRTGEQFRVRQYMRKGRKHEIMTRNYDVYLQDGISISVLGRLQEHVAFWEDIGAPNYIKNQEWCIYTICRQLMFCDVCVSFSDAVSIS